MRLLSYWSVWFIGFWSWVLGPLHAQPAPGSVYVLEIRGVINPPTAGYLARALDDAAAREAGLVVVELDTPGGLDTAMREMTQSILASPVPVAVYVAPSGARAASAGLFILLAAHVAAMAPGTNTGAAHPVGLGGDIDDVSASKAVNDAAATIRALAAQHGRNTEWAERAVRESVSITDEEALTLGVIDLVAHDVDELLQELDGQTVQTAEGGVTLAVTRAPRHAAPMNLAERFLHIISDPNVAFVLLSLGTLGILAELFNPGTLVPGITGVIALILAFFSLGNLPTNWAGVALIALAVILFVAELNTEGTGFLGVGAVVAFLLGGLILFQRFRPGSPALPDLSVSPWLLGAMTVGLGALVLLVMAQVVRARRTPVHSGPEALIGQTAEVYQDLDPLGRVWFQGQPWYARLSSEGVAHTGQVVRIVDLEGLTLRVEPVDRDNGTADERATDSNK